MIDLAGPLTAAAGFISALVPLGGGIKWLARRNDKRFTAIEDKLAECEKREKIAATRDAKQLIVIELLWQAASRSKAAAPVVERCREHLDELKLKTKELAEK